MRAARRPADADADADAAVLAPTPAGTAHLLAAGGDAGALPDAVATVLP